MEFRGNILFSIILHAMIFTAALALAGRELAVRPTERFVAVSLFEDHADTSTPAAKITPKKKAAGNDRKSAAVPREPLPPGAASTAGKPDPAPPPAIMAEQSPRRIEALRTSGPTGAAATTNPAPAGDIQGTSHAAIQASIIGTPTSQADGQGGTGTDSAGTLLKVTAIRAAIEKAKNYPPLARERGFEGTVTAEFTISTAGHPEHIRILRSSGYEILDAAAKKTILRASPLPVIAGILEVPITFRLER